VAVAAAAGKARLPVEKSLENGKDHECTASHLLLNNFAVHRNKLKQLKKIYQTKTKLEQFTQRQETLATILALHLARLVHGWVIITGGKC